MVIIDYVPHLLGAGAVEIDDDASAFVLETSGGDRVDIAEALGRKRVLLVFHGGYQCSTCRTQLRKLRRELGRIRALGTEILAVSDDPPIDAKRVAAELGHEIPVLWDRTRWVGHHYGMRDPARRFTLTGYVVIDVAGKVRARRVDPLFGEHGDEILSILEQAARSTRH